ncbi:hypothetical protein [Streptomyces qinzhouensis]|uniref:Uncharacterized protein n=1 Tax=Streptomyces qinzhouensis TaxID=2599401 RepID=A0A5B8IE94_9ACTN|nr:hypothetical protein [Streptomyces qinzhouensis]QDY76808.1 hypothetical protein FQU76_09990 [Streptomyces qinzhouensis]
MGEVEQFVMAEDHGTRTARKAFGRELAALRNRAVARGTATFAACAAVAGVSLTTVRAWCEGEAAPGEDTEAGAQRLIRYLLREAGEAGEGVEPDGMWFRLLGAAQREGGTFRASSRERDAAREFLRTIGAEALLGRSFSGRRSALSDTLDFVRGPAEVEKNHQDIAYLWWQAPAGGGKSALLGAVAKRLRSEPVDIVLYPAPADAGPDAGRLFMSAVVRRLMELLEIRTTSKDLGALYRAAALHSARQGRRLVVVVDDADHDPAWSPAASGAEAYRSILSLLPYEPLADSPWARRHRGKYAIRVIVTSRPVSTLPGDIPPGHPLHDPGCIQALRPVAPGRAHPRHLREALGPLLATAEGRLVAGLIAAAGTGLGRADLVELTGEGPLSVDALLEGPGQDCLVRDDLGTGSYAFGHEGLRRLAEVECGRETLEDCARRLRAWADRWHLRRWPPDTPPALLWHLPVLLRGTGPVGPYLLDPFRQSRLVAMGRPDEALSQLDHVRAEGDEDLGTAALAAVSRAFLTGLGKPVPRALPRLLAVAGEVDRAGELALSAPEAVDKAVRLAEVAVVLSRARHDRAAATAQRAAEAAECALAQVSPGAVRDARYEQLARTGLKLMDCGPAEAGRRIARAALPCSAVGWAARIDMARKLDPRNVPWLLRVAEYAETLSVGRAGERAEALEIWGELARAVPHGDPAFRCLVAGYRCAESASGTAERASRCGADRTPKCSAPEVPRGGAAVRHRIEVFCGELDPASDPAHIGLLALGASALFPERRAKARTLAKRARQALRDLLADTGMPAGRDGTELPSTVARVVQALLDTGLTRAAEELHDELPDFPNFPGSAGCAGEELRDAARAVSERGGRRTGAEEPDAWAAETERELIARPARGRRLLAAELDRWDSRASGPGGHGWELPLAKALTAAGYPEQAVRLVGRAGPSRTRSSAVRPAPRIADVRARARLPHRRELLLPELVDLLLAEPDPRRPGGELCALFRQVCADLGRNLQTRNPYAVLLHALLDTAGLPTGVAPLKGRFTAWERYMATAPLPPGVLPVAEWAVLYAFRGDTGAARECAGRARTAEERAVARSAVAAYLLGIPDTEESGAALWGASVVRFVSLADALGPPVSARGTEAVQGLVHDVLSGAYWWYGLPLLPRSASDALPRLAELVAGHPERSGRSVHRSGGDLGRGLGER